IRAPLALNSCVRFYIDWSSSPICNVPVKNNFAILRVNCGSDRPPGASQRLGYLLDCSARDRTHTLELRPLPHAKRFFKILRTCAHTMPANNHGEYPEDMGARCEYQRLLFDDRL